MKSMKTAAIALAVLTAAAASPASAATTVQVSLWDKGTDAVMATDLMYGMPNVDLSKATMGIKTSTSTAKAGIVTFRVKNDSKDTVHEMIVMQLAAPGKPLPYVASEKAVDEDKAGDKGEVSELDPGGSGALTLNMKPGEYLLICNVPGHYAAGMWTTFTVTK